MKRAFAMSLLLLCLTFACEDDPTRTQPTDNTTLLPLTSKYAVLNNLEVAWNKRTPQAIDDLLDAGFTFVFQAGDVGGPIPSQWGRVDELAATTALLRSHVVTPPVAPVCTKVIVDLDLGDVQWREFPVATSSSEPTEFWYTTTVEYSFRFDVEPGLSYSSAPNSKAQFTVREFEGAWRLVEWRDLGGNVMTMSGAAVESPTWGRMKFIYY